MIELPSLKELLDAGAHFGHKKERSYPKAKQYTYMLKDQIYVIDLEKTREKLEEALKYIEKMATEGKALLIVGTKRQAQELVAQYAKAADLPYISYRWLGGMLTNFETIRRRIKFLDELDGKLSEENLQSLTKKEKAKLQEEANKLHKVFDGIRNLKKLPDALFIVDVVGEKIAICEAQKMDIPVIGIADTNANPELIQYPIPANDDAKKTIEIILALVSKAYQEGAKKMKVDKGEKLEKKDEKSVEVVRKGDKGVGAVKQEE
ncbi:MAG: 30S ribosomal protein S2 [bacterium]|nr:30S ribosomal protein S2 [bacterium]